MQQFLKNLNSGYLKIKYSLSKANGSSIDDEQIMIYQYSLKSLFDKKRIIKNMRMMMLIHQRLMVKLEN